MASTEGVRVEGDQYEFMYPKGLETALAAQRIRRLKIGGAIAVALLLIGGIAAMAATGQFSSTGWLRQTAFPAIKEAFENFGKWVETNVIKPIAEFMDKKAVYGMLIGAGSVLTVGGISYGIHKCRTPKPIDQYTQFLEIPQENADNPSGQETGLYDPSL